MMQHGRISGASLIISGLRACHGMALSVLYRWVRWGHSPSEAGPGGIAEEAPGPGTEPPTASALEPTNGGERRAKGTLCKLLARSGNHTSCASGIPGAQAHPRSDIWQFRLWPESVRTSIELPAVGPAIWGAGPPPIPPTAGLTSAQARARALPFRALATRHFAATRRATVPRNSW